MNPFLKTGALVAVLCAAASLTSLAAQAQDTKLVLRIADSFPRDHYIPRYLVKYWIDTVTAASKGELTFEYYPSEQLGKAKDLLSLTVSGVVDVGYVLPSYVSDKMPLSDVVNLPGKFSSSCAGLTAFSKLSTDGMLAQREYAPNGVRVLFSFVAAPYQIVMRPGFASLKDLEGRKLRSVSWAQETILRHLKAVPVRMSAPDTYEAMSRGTIDGTLLPYSSIESYKLPAKYVSVGENFGPVAGHYMISEQRWKRIPAHLQKIMQEAGEAASRRACALIDKEENDELNNLRRRQVVGVRLSPDDKRQLATVNSAVAQEWADALDKRGKRGTEVLEAFNDALAVDLDSTRR